MSIVLTDEQQQALDLPHDEPVRVIDPRTNDAYVLVRAEQYESVRALLEEETPQRAIRAVGLRNAIGRMNEECHHG